MSTQRLLSSLLATAFALAASVPVAAGVRSSLPLAVHPTEAASIAAATISAPSGAAPATAADSVRTTDPESKHAALMDQLLRDRRTSLSAAVRAAAAAVVLPSVPGPPVSGENENVFAFVGLSNVDPANVNEGFSGEPRRSSFTQRKYIAECDRS